MALRIAPRGWEHDGWSGSFYPDDLPPEWRLFYFCNHFGAVVVPEGRWRDAAPETFGLWREDSSPAMRFYLETGYPVPVEAHSAATLLGERFGGFVTGDAGAEGLAVARWRGDVADLRGLRSAIEALAGGGESLLIVEGNPPSLEAVRAARTIADLLGIS